jgi:hypothetical protein
MARTSPAAWLLSSLLAFTAASADAPALAPQDLEPLLGDPWTGTLTYLDYGTGKPVSIRTTLVVTRSAADPARWFFDYGYPDEPDEASREEVVVGDGGRTLGGEAVVELARPAAGPLVVVTESRGTDDDKPATIRRTYEIGAGGFSVAKHVRQDGAAGFVERNRYRWAR